MLHFQQRRGYNSYKPRLPDTTNGLVHVPRQVKHAKLTLSFRILHLWHALIFRTLATSILRSRENACLLLGEHSEFPSRGKDERKSCFPLLIWFWVMVLLVVISWEEAEEAEDSTTAGEMALETVAVGAPWEAGRASKVAWSWGVERRGSLCGREISSNEKEELWGSGSKLRNAFQSKSSSMKGNTGSSFGARLGGSG